MAVDREHRIKLVLTGDADKGFKVLTTETKKARRELKKLQKEGTKLDKQLRRLHDGLIVGKNAWGAISGAVTKVRDSYVNLDRVQKRLAFGLESTGLSADKAKEKMRGLTAAFEESARQTLFSVEEQSRAFDTIVRTTGDVEGAMDVLTLAMDGATRTGKDLTDASKSLAEAVNGDLGPLKEMGLLTSQQITYFNSITDSTARWEAALEQIKPKLEGARNSISDVTKNSQRLNADAEKLIGTFGKFVAGLGEATASMAGFGDETNKSQTALGNFADELSTATDNMVQYVKEASALEKAQDAFRLFATGGIVGVLAGYNAFEKTRVKIEERVTARNKKFIEKQQKLAADDFLTYGPYYDPSKFIDPKKPPKGPKMTEAERLLALAPPDVSRRQGISDIVREEFEEPAAREQRAQRELEILRSTNDAEKVRLELKLQLEEINQQELGTIEKRLAIEKALLDAKTKMDAVDATAAENARKRTAKKTQQVKAEKEALRLAQEQQNAAVQAGISGAIALADTVIESDRAVAGIKALYEAAQAAASYPDPVGMIQHGIAAAQFAAIASGAGGASGGAAGGGGMVGGAVSSGGSQIAATGRENARLFAEELANAQEVARPIQINIDMGQAVTLEDSQRTARRIANAVETAQTNQIRVS